MVRVAIEYFARRGGYKEVAEIGCFDDKQKPPSSSTLASLNPSAVAHQAYELASKDHKRNARTHYRMQLWHAGPKRNDDERKGEYATIRFDGAEEASHHHTPEASVFKVIRDMLQDARKFALEMANAQIQMAQAASGTSLYGLQMVDEMARRKSELADVAAQMRMQPSADDVNRRIESVMSRVEGPLNTLATAMAPKVQQWASGMGMPTGGPGPQAPNPQASQARAQAFFSGLTADQSDALRDCMGAEKFAALAEVINGTLEQWVTEAQNIKPTLMPHMPDLQRILNREQFQQLMEL